MNPHEVVRILDKHGRWLAGFPGGVRADLSTKDLQGFTFAGADMRRAKLPGTNLMACDFTEFERFIGTPEFEERAARYGVGT